jgi:uncharacterized protein YcgI (DUF1989 family)
LSRHGLTKRDIVSNLNFLHDPFMIVPIDPAGNFTVVDRQLCRRDRGHGWLCAIFNCPQVNNPPNGFNPAPIRVVVRDAPGQIRM